MENYTVFTMNHIKDFVKDNAAFLKDQIDSCREGQIISIPTLLPNGCYPDKANICFSSYEGEYAPHRMYCVMTDRQVAYFGTNHSFNELFDKRIVVFDNWKQLKDFFNHLPYVS